jgi:predicted DNA binding protein
MKKLKKIVLKVPLDPRYNEFFNLLEKYELLQIHRQDDDQIFVTQKIKFKDIKMDPKMLEGEHYGMSYIEVLKEDRVKNEFIFFSKMNWVKEVKEFLKKLDLIIDPPLIINQDHILVSVLTDNKNIDEMIDSLNFYYDGKLEILSISPIHLNIGNLFLKLTDRQKEIVYYAVQHGYFEIPRRINSKKIANHFKISRSALYDHLRKIDRTIFHSIFK